MAEEADTKKAVTLSEGETKLFISIMKNLESDIQFNAEAVADECGYKSSKVVKDRWSQIKKNKLGLAPGAGTKATPKAAAKKRKGEEDGVAIPTPSKKGNQGKAKGKKGEERDDGGKVKGEDVKMEGVVKEELDDDFGDDGEE